MTKTLNSQVKALVKQAPAKELAEALGDLVLKRLRDAKVRELDAVVRRCPAPTPTAWPDPYPDRPDRQAPAPMSPSRARSTPRARGGRRRGRIQNYEVTGKRNDARWGTWRHYMINMVLKHTSTLSAEIDHETNCDNPKFAKNRLDFGWCAANGFINFI